MKRFWKIRLLLLVALATAGVAAGCSAVSDTPSAREAAATPSPSVTDQPTSEPTRSVISTTEAPVATVGLATAQPTATSEPNLVPTATPVDPAFEACVFPRKLIQTFVGYETLGALVEASDLGVIGEVTGRRMAEDRYRDRIDVWAVHQISVDVVLSGESIASEITLATTNTCFEPGEYVFFSESVGPRFQSIDDPALSQSPGQYVYLGPRSVIRLKDGFIDADSTLVPPLRNGMSLRELEQEFAKLRLETSR